MATAAAPAFRFPVYQIDFSAVASGKRVAATKRRIRWRFGFPNRQALEAGRTGTDCRGEEHEVVIVWSITSGKRQVLMDGKEIHYAASRTSVMDHSWSTRGNHVMKVVCHASPPMSPTPGFRQYDFFIDGQSFFTMPKVYELGIKGVTDRSVPRPYGAPPVSPEHGYYAGSGVGGGGGDYNNGYGGYGGSPARSLTASGIPVPLSRQEEEEELQRAIQISLQESASHLGEKPKSESSIEKAPSSDLLDFGGDDFSSTTGATSSMMPSLPPPMPAQPGFSNYPATSSMTYDSNMMPVAPAPATTASYPSGSFPSDSYPGAPTPPAYGGGYGGAYGGGYGAPAPGPYAALPPPVPAYGTPTAPAPMSASFAGTPAAPGPDAATLLAGSMGNSGQGDRFFDTNPVVDDPFAPKPPPPPSHRDIASEILSAYGPTTPGYQPGVPTTPMAGGYGSGVSNGYAGTPLALENGGDGSYAAVGSPPSVPATPSLTMNGLADTDENKPADPFEAALKRLVNVDRIDEPAEEVMKLTMKKKEEEVQKKNANKSKPKPPAAHQVVGNQATLAQIKSVKPSSSDQPKEGIMKPPPQLWQANASMAGALVVHGTHPPPLQQPGFVGQGFGAGYNPYAQQQQQQQYMMQQQQQQQQYQYR